jgi:RimJ/RimL family protein N-acetyltransferase
MQYLIDYAASPGIHEIFGDVMAENAAMLGLCRNFGFKIAAVCREGLLGVSLDPLRR